MKRQKISRRRGRFLYSFPVKGILYLVMMTAIGAAVFSLLAGIGCMRLEKYRGSEEIQEQLLEFHAWQQAREILRIYLSQGMEQVEAYAERENASYVLYKISGRRIGGNYKEEKTEQILQLGSKLLQFDFQFSGNIMDGLEYSGQDVRSYHVRIAYLEDEQVRAVQPCLQGIPERLQIWMERFWMAAGIAACIAVAAFGYLLEVSGHCPGESKVEGERPEKAPIEVLLFWWIAAVPVWLRGKETAPVWAIPIAWPDDAETVMSLLGQSIREMTLQGILYGILATGFLLCFSLYVKAGKWWQYSLVWKLAQAPKKAMEQLSWLKKVLAVLLAVCCLEAAGIGLAQHLLMSGYGADKLQNWLSGYGRWMIWGLWGAEKVFLAALVLRKARNVMQLRISGRQLAEGNLGYQMPLGGMKGELLRFGQDMNAISQVVAAAVEDRMKSEHLKTELITNVSHDIKTPLTSIINYADLIGRERTENEKITEYAGVLHRQSTRLKKLIEDLMEASKVSTGNLEVHLERCQAGVLLNQVMGEFEERLQKRELDLVVKQGQEPVWILADPRMLWRILDNLMNNICKYAQSNTRVYLSLEVLEGQAKLVFKNVSRYPLDIDASELMERFVRGDRSRHTEGSGLGLSIAKSLTQLQGGEMELTVDGDLFKVTLTFPVVEEEESS